MARLIKKEKQKELTLREFYEKRNKILIWNKLGGLGDVISQRMIFEDLKKTIPEADFIFACPEAYIDAAKDHPDLKDVISSKDVQVEDYLVHYNTCVTVTHNYESNNAPCEENRADIWAKFCGVKLKNHNMKFNLDEKLREQCKKKITKENKKTIIFAPKSAMITKSLLQHQIDAIVECTKEYNLVAIHSREIPELKKHNIEIINTSVKEWMCYIDAADYVISVDSAAFHMAGGLGKDVLGIFTWADGYACGKYYPNAKYIQLHRKDGNWDCGPCFNYENCKKSNDRLKPCLTEITKEMIENGVKRLLKNSSNLEKN
ncbi:MAG: lipopolysaccharide heptosyltransferase family protein [Neisseriaceae bacterium]|nr:MAG: lipopolysaccharide heptosyltransferase family protein [Neisseriaceae bacterium]